MDFVIIAVLGSLDSSCACNVERWLGTNQHCCSGRTIVRMSMFLLALQPCEKCPS